MGGDEAIIPLSESIANGTEKLLLALVTITRTKCKSIGSVQSLPTNLLDHFPEIGNCFPEYEGAQTHKQFVTTKCQRYMLIAVPPKSVYTFLSQLIGCGL